MSAAESLRVGAGCSNASALDAAGNFATSSGGFFGIAEQIAPSIAVEHIAGACTVRALSANLVKLC